MSALRSFAAEEMAAAEHVERQVAVAVVIAVEEAAFLMAVQRVVGGVEIELLNSWRSRPPKRGDVARRNGMMPPTKTR